MAVKDQSGERDEQPVHEVSVARFAIGRYAVTFEEYDRFAEATVARSSNSGPARM